MASVGPSLHKQHETSGPTFLNAHKPLEKLGRARHIVKQPKPSDYPKVDNIA